MVSKANSKHSHQKSLSRTDLAKYFDSKKKVIEEEVRSRTSKASNASAFKAKFLKRLEEQSEQR